MQFCINLIVLCQHGNSGFNFHFYSRNRSSSPNIHFPGRERLCGRFWSIDTTVISKLARGEIALQPSVTAQSRLERKGNHLQVCVTMLYVSVCLHGYAVKIR